MKYMMFYLSTFLMFLIAFDKLECSFASDNIKGPFYEKNKYFDFKKINFKEKYTSSSDSAKNAKFIKKVKSETNNKSNNDSKIILSKNSDKSENQITSNRVSESTLSGKSFRKNKYSYEKKISKIDNQVEISKSIKEISKDNGPIKNHSEFTNDYEIEKQNNIKTFKNNKNIDKNRFFENKISNANNNLIENSNKRKNPFSTESSMELTLPSIEIDNRHKIDYYYPYFYKTHILEYQEVIDYKNLSNNCSDLGCNWCDANMRNICFECRHGFFLYQENCYTTCPQNHYADIFKKKCIPIDTQTASYQITYLKAFTVGSCKNKCGGLAQDCSCRNDCILQGNCCSDYSECESLFKSNQNKGNDCASKIPNCELCDYSFFNKISCKQCNQNSFLRNGECVNSCFPSDYSMETNKICIKNQDCRVDNCAECVDGNPAVCKHCHNGFYMFNNQCISVCPNKYRADRISWVCLEAPVFAWYWIFPSRSTCFKNCGKGMNNREMDCSCSEDCFRLGNCCQDIEDHCVNYIFWK